jgi:methyl-accepting chemotaxis protein
MQIKPFKLFDFFKSHHLSDYHLQTQAINRCQAIIEFDRNGYILDANENFLNAMGYTLKEIVGQHHRMFVSSDYANSTDYQNFWKQLNAGEHFTNDYLRYGKNGKEVWIHASYNPVYSPRGDVIKIVKYATDITDQKNLNLNYEGQIQAIKRSQAVIEFDPNGYILDANENFLNVMGYTFAEIIGQHHRMFVSPEYANTIEYQNFWKRLSSGEYFSNDYLRFGKNGKEVWIHASYNPIFNSRGDVIKIVKYASDITAQKNLNMNYEGQIQAIKRSQAVIEFDPNGYILDANENFLNVMGYRLDEIVGQHHRMFVRSDYANSLEYQDFWKELRAGNFVSKVFDRIGKNAAVVWIQGSYNPIFDAKNQVVKIVKYATDITGVVDLIEDTSNKMKTFLLSVTELSGAIQEISHNMSKTESASREIGLQTQKSLNAGTSLINSSNSMSHLIIAIKHISEQVNLLALNASIEAAKAGDFGRGFNVVAAEIKKLASATKETTENVTSEISDSQRISNDIVDDIQKISSFAEKVGEYMSSVSAAIQEQSVVADSIFDRSNSISAKVDEMNKRIKSL